MREGYSGFLADVRALPAGPFLFSILFFFLFLSKFFNWFFIHQKIKKNQPAHSCQFVWSATRSCTTLERWFLTWRLAMANTSALAMAVTLVFAMARINILAIAKTLVLAMAGSPLQSCQGCCATAVASAQFPAMSVFNTKNEHQKWKSLVFYLNKSLV